MRFPPVLVRLRLVSPPRLRVSLWLPVFLFWPLLLAFLLPVLALAAVAAALATGRFGLIPELASSLYSLVCATRGTHIDVSGDQAQVLVSIY